MGIDEAGEGPSEELKERCRAFLKKIPNNLNYILPEDLFDLMAQSPEDIFVLDNRTPEAFEAGHIPGAVNMWIRDALDPENVQRIPTDKKVVVCCWVGHTASQLLTILRLLGYDAVGLKYGMGVAANPDEPRLGWIDRGLPVSVGDSQ